MPKFERIRDRLPTLYRPDEGDASLLTTLLRAIGDVLDEAGRDAGLVMQARWFAYADRALYDPGFIGSRKLQGLPPPAPNDPSLKVFPYVLDLARLGALLSLALWEQPPALRELVEQYRLRIGRTVILYRNGLGTPGALRGMVESQLPVDLNAPEERKDRPFSVEDFAPLASETVAVRARGEPLEMVGPLMRWSLANDGVDAVCPTLFLQGVEPLAGLIDATVNPVVELYEAAGRRIRLGIGYRGTIAAGQTLRLRPAYSSWLGMGDGVRRSNVNPSAEGAADPTAPGPWQAVAGGPAAGVVAFHQSADLTLWTATNTGAVGTLWRYDGKAWTAALPGLPRLRCLAEDAQDLLIGTSNGLLRMPLFPPAGGQFAATIVVALSGREINAVFRARDGQLWVGTDSGAVKLLSGDATEQTPLGKDGAASTAVYSVAQDATGILYFGTALGVFQHRSRTGEWYWYAGEEGTEQVADWQRFNPGETGEARNFPTEARVFLPPVRCLLRGPDASLWLGTENGIARYVAAPVRGLTYTTLLQAFPDLSTGRVHAIREDARGLVWFCTDRGLFRYDGRDWWQFQGDTWVQLGRADSLYDGPVEARGGWRFERASSHWQRIDAATSRWRTSGSAARSHAEPEVQALAWSDGVFAEIGKWDGAKFSDPAPVGGEALVVRYKPSEQR
ncbi:MAG: hypothetical protein HY330_02355, partial [Chloroflexi bacterium]|nr:hypothetical protein [Chloroflexota bacterium]